MNYLNQRTTYKYDSADNMVEEASHPLVNPDGRKVKQVISYRYDHYHRQIEERCGEEGISTKKYNALGNVIEEIGCDGGVSRFYYNLDQTLDEKILSSGARVKFTYDAQKRLLAETTYDTDLKELRKKEFTYKGGQLVKESDLEGSVEYIYDIANRLIEKSDGSKMTKYGYDPLGNLSHEIACGKNPVHTYRVFDLLGQVLEEKQVCNGEVIHLVKYKYDAHGNICEKRRLTSVGEVSEQFSYNAYGELVEQVDEAGQKTKIDYSSIEGNGCKLLVKTTTSAKGIQTVETFNEVGLVKCIEKKELQKEEYHYNAKLEKVEQRSTLYLDGSVVDCLSTKWEYDPSGNAILQKEANGRETSTQFTHFSKPKWRRNANGVTLEYTYNGIGEVKRLVSSDNTIDYIYAYDGRGRLIKVEDAISKKEEKVSYDCNNQPLIYQQQNGLVVKMAYDEMGNRTELVLPDLTTIDYQYEGFQLRGVKRGDYTHTFKKYDPSGISLSEELMLNLGEVNCHLDKYGRVQKVVHPEVKHTIDERDANGNVTSSTLTYECGQYETTYAYDDLDQLITETGPFPHLYRFDSHHILRGKDGHSSRIDLGHQLISLNSTEVAYDLNGNRRLLITPEGLTRYSYDALNRLISVATPSRSVHYTYDSQHRCMSRVCKKGDKVVERVDFCYDGQNEMGAFIEGHPHEVRVLGETPLGEIGSTLLIEIEGKPYVPIHDLFGNITTLLSRNGVSHNTLINSFGEYFSVDDEGYVKTDLTDNQWVFQSKRRDPITKLVNFGRRFYDPVIGSFINPDPKGLDHIPNPYHYLSNNPLTNYDPWGLEQQVRTRMLSFAEINRQCTSLYQGLSGVLELPRVQGAIELSVGMAEMSAGVMIGIGGTPLSGGASLVLGGLAFGHGADRAWTGLNMLVSGSFQPTLTAHALQKTGLSPSNANFANDLISMLLMGQGFSLNRGEPIRSVPRSTTLIKPDIVGENGITPRNFFGNKTHSEVKSLLSHKFGQPRGRGMYNESYFNPRTGRTYNLHWDPNHRGGLPHVDIRKRGISNDFYKDRPLFLRNGK